MYLRRIEIHGFKTFPRKTVLEFGSGVSAIIGPNGSGKSNIADAVRWALGEQTMRNLRGQRTEDVIFAGGPNRARTGMAEVSLVFDNSDGWLPIDFSEVLVTRRGYRSGENEYLINNSTVRLKDVQDLLRSGALGVNGHVVIGQGQIDSALSLRPEDRRLLLEESAGISRHYARRDEAQRRLVETERNLERLRDLHAELGPRLDQLKLQAETAERSVDVREELRQCLHALAAHRLWQAQAIVDSAVSAEAEAAAKIAEFETRQQSSDDSALAGELARSQKLLDEANRTVDALRSELAELTAGGRLASQRSEFEDHRAVDLHARYSELSVALEALEQAVTEQRAVIQETKTRIRELEAHLEAGGAEQGPAVEVQTLQTAATQARRAAMQLAAEIAQLQEADRGLAVREREARTDAGQAGLDLEKLESSLGFLQARVDSATNRVLRTQSQIASSREARARAASGVNAARVALEKARSAALQQRIAIEGLKAESAAIAAANAGTQSARRGVTALLQEAARLHIRGLVRSGLEEVTEDLLRVVEAALGHLLEDVVLDHVADLNPAIDELRGLEGETVRFRPAAGFQYEQRRGIFGGGTPRGPGIVGTLDALVRVKPEFQDVLGPVLASILVVDKLATAVGLRSEGGQASAYHIVTLDGEYLDRDGSVLVGRRSAGSRTAMEQRLAELNFRSESAQQPLANLESQEIQAQEDLNTALRAEESAAADLEAVLNAIGETKTVLRGAEQDVSLARRQTAWWKTLVERSQAALAEIGLRRETARARMAELQIRIAPTRKAVEDTETALAQAQTGAFDGSVARLQVERERLAHLLDRLSRDSADLDARRRAAVAVQNELVAARRLKEEAAAEAVRLEAGCAACRLRLEASVSQLETIRQEQSGLVLARERAALAAGSRELELARLQAALQSAQDRIESARQRIDDLRGRALEELGDAGMGAARYSGSIGELEARIEHTRRLVNEIGPVNPLAPAQFKEESERRRFLENQIEDMDKSAADLSKIARDLESAVRAEFMDTFATIRKGFDDYFRVLMGGGKAEMTLTDPLHLATTGVDIDVQIPGKRRQPLPALSGGERGLVAAALLFAVLNARPAPLCVLDEVDAALDDDNTERFRSLLHEFAAATQFIVITHNPGTIQEAGSIFGVTMASDGVSQVVSLRLNGVDQKAGSGRAQAATRP